MGETKIRVLVVDDSAVIRKLVSGLLNRAPDIEVIDTANDPFEARDKLLQHRPDVMTLDIEMPRMDGITFVKKVMEYFPTRTLVVSSLSIKGSSTAFRALENGAIDVLCKPELTNMTEIEAFGRELIEKVRVVASSKIIAKNPLEKKPAAPTPVPRAPGAVGSPAGSRQILAIASSTGGTEALKQVLPYLPPDIPGTVVVQHMPATFTKSFANALQALCPFEVCEAKEGDRITQGKVLIAPGDFHMEIKKGGGSYFVSLNQAPPQHGVRPAADLLFHSVARLVGGNAIGLVLTGMGRDGAAGLLAMKTAGSYNIVQNEASCVVFGMPREAIRVGAADEVLALRDIPAALGKAFVERAKAS